tara:strand:+ start:92 stop:445 length:354 start_codon:yes stop_codon:yes gene_type:complete
MWLLLQRENGYEFIVNDNSINRIEKTSIGKEKRVVEDVLDLPQRSDHYSHHVFRKETFEDENFRFNIIYDNGKSDNNVIILNVGELNVFYEDGGYLKEIFNSKSIKLQSRSSQRKLR